ncbi:8-amino-7-oxononanoate synthase [Sinimarinibacterium thermocellulolyticum]|uniref:8-amino-7-oxononanoate synthase n=1 Tax=Sinimarinibacterium thermocellulolyticum TaxID=3170016 RepID=A0ABV2ADA8_9GAMM
MLAVSEAAPVGAGATLQERLARALSQLRDADLYRVRRIVDGGHGVQMRVDGRRCVNFCSNDYLGLATDPRVAEAARRVLARDGTGSSASALICGHNREHRALEEALAEFVGRPRALLFSSGWAANLGVLRALLGKDDVLVADELNHASLIDGGRLSGARYVRVAHADVQGFDDALRLALVERPQALRLVVTDSVFSMDGDVAPLLPLSRLCEARGAALMVDDAHGFGVLGASGQGACALHVVQPQVYVATLGKSLGCAGAFVAGSHELIEYLVQRARSWVFSTAPPPALAAAARAALAIVAGAEGAERRARLFANVARFRSGCRQCGIALGASETPIQPLIVGSETATLALSRRLYDAGLWVAAIRPPTVPRGTSRLRVTLTAAHTDAQIDHLVDALREAVSSLQEGTAVAGN